MSNQPSHIITPPGRIVGGSVFQGNTKKQDGTPLTMKDGTPRTEYFLYFALPKDAPRVGDQPSAADVLEYMRQAGAEGFPALFAKSGGQFPAGFSTKIKDGDDATPVLKGKPNNERIGWAGCWVLACSQPTEPPKVIDVQGNTITADMKDAAPLGYTARLMLKCRGNGSTQSPGIYVTHAAVQIVGGTPADVIQLGVDAATAFGAVGAPVLPAGVQPAAIQPTAMPAFNPSATVPASAPGPNVQPMPAFGTPEHVAAAAAPAPLPPIAPPAPVTGPPAGHKLHPQCQETWAQLMAMGQTAETLMASGYLVPV